MVATSGAVPLKLPEAFFPETLVEIRGEIWISTMRMEALNKEQEAQGKKGWVSPRNLAAGTLKLKDLAEVKRRGIKFMPWDVSGVPAEYLAKLHRDPRWSSHGLDYVHRAAGMAQPLLRSFEGKVLLEGLENHIASMRKEREVMWHGPGFGMLTDGLVIKVEDPGMREELGEEARCPNWAVSYKFQDSRGITTLLDIQWSVSRNGKLTPVGILDPIVLNGASISRVNLNNPSYMEELGLSLGCKVELLRSGDVIPIITKVVED
jgi:DNA ligase (NAD+)